MAEDLAPAREPRLPDGVVVSRYAQSDRAALIAFRRDHYGAGAAQADPAWVDWEFRDAPGIRERGAPLWLARKDGEVIGTLARIRTTLVAGGEEVPAAWVVDFAVRDRLRRSGIGEALGAASREEPASRLILEIASQARGISNRFGYRSVGEVPLFVRPLHPDRWLRTHRVPAPLARLSALALPLLAALDRRSLRRAREAGIDLVGTAGFDERADALFAELSQRYPVLCRRDRAWLEWRFQRHPRPSRYALHWLTQRGRAVGYAVLRAGSHRGAPAVVLVDYLCAPELIRPLLARCLERFRDAGAAVMACLHLSPFAARPFRLSGFFRRTSGWPLLVQPGIAGDRAARLMVRADQWFLTAADSNVDRA